MLTRPLGDHPVHWRAEQSTWDGYRDAGGVAPLELHALFELPDGPLTCWLHILSFTDRDAAAVHFVAKAGAAGARALRATRRRATPRASRRARASGLAPQRRRRGGAAVGDAGESQQAGAPAPIVPVAQRERLPQRELERPLGARAERHAGPRGGRGGSRAARRARPARTTPPPTGAPRRGRCRSRPARPRRASSPGQAPPPPARSVGAPASRETRTPAAIHPPAASPSSRCSVPMWSWPSAAASSCATHDHVARPAREPLEHQRPLRSSRPPPCFLCTACLLTPQHPRDLLPAPAALARVAHLQLLERLEQRAQRRHGGEPDGRVAAGGGVGQLRCLVMRQPTLTARVCQPSLTEPASDKVAPACSASPHAARRRRRGGDRRARAAAAARRAPARRCATAPTELSFYEHAADLPPREQLEAAAGTADWTEEEVPDDPLERRRLHGRAWEVAGRLRVRSPDDPPGDGSLPELVIESAAGAFGTGAHPTTRMCLELLLSTRARRPVRRPRLRRGHARDRGGAARLGAGLRGRPRAAERRRHAPQRRAQRRARRGAGARPRAGRAAARADARGQRAAADPRAAWPRVSRPR